MPLDRRQFLNNALVVIPSTLALPHNLHPQIDDLVEFFAGSPQQVQVENLSEELASLVEMHHTKIPTYQRRAKTSYGRLAHIRYETEGIPTAYGATGAAGFATESGHVEVFGPTPAKPSGRYTKDEVQLITPGVSGVSIDIEILRLPKPILILDKNGNDPPFKQEMYIDSDFDGVPNRAYRGEGIWHHGLPDKYLVDLGKMKPGQANYFRQGFPQELRLVINALRGYLKLPLQQNQLIR